MAVTQYIIVKGELWMNDSGHGESWMSTSGRYSTRRLAIYDGLALFGHDDFNIGELVDGKLARLFWMHEDMHESPEQIREIAQQLALEAAR